MPQGVWALDRWLRRIGLPRWLAALVALTLVLGTPLAFYGLRAYTYSHLGSAVAVLWLLLAVMRLGDRPTIFWALLVGVDGEAGRVALNVTGEDGEAVALEAALARPPDGPGRFTLAVGTPRDEEWHWPPAWRTRYSDLELRARNVCRDRPPE